MDLFETPNRNSIMQLLESPTDAEIKFRRFIESKQKSKFSSFKNLYFIEKYT